MSSPDSAAALHLAQFSLDHADEAAFWTTPEGQFLYANAAASGALGYPLPQLQAMTLFQVSPEFTPALWAQLWKETKTHGKFSFEFSLQTRDQRELAVEMTVHYVPLADREILCGFFHDVNEKKRLEQMKNEFVSTVSHELRTPITIIREGVAQVLDNLWGDVTVQQREALTISLTGIDRLARIINDLLDASRMEAGKVVLRWENFNLCGLVEEVVGAFATQAKERGFSLHTVFPHPSVEVYADRDRIVQVLTNLLGNALKFSAQGKIEVMVRDREHEVECSVSDSGLGIAAEDLERVFHKFVQLGQPSVTGEKGTGLGLSICKGIIDLHSGKIWAKSEVNHGSTFFFALPKKSVRDLFQKTVNSELLQAIGSGGSLSIIHFGINESMPMVSSSDQGQRTWVIEELVQLIKIHGARKTDTVMKDTDAVWMILPSMVKKEAARFEERILGLLTDMLAKKGLTQEIQVTVRSYSYPDDFKTEDELMTRMIQDGTHHDR